MTKSGQAVIFNAFWRAAGLDVDPASIEEPDRNSGLPDIMCRVDGEDVGFELTAATNEEVHKHAALGSASAMWIGPGEIEGVRTCPPEVVLALRRKIDRRYTGNMPIELLVHEGLAKLDISDSWLGDFELEARAVIAGSVFRRVWVTSHSGASIYAAYPHVATENSPPP